MALGDMIPGLGSAVDEISGQPKQSSGGSHFILTVSDFDTTWGDNIEAGAWVDVAEFIVGAQTQYNVGYGASDRPATVGRWYAVFQDGSGNVVKGQVRIVTRNANDKAVETDISGLSTTRLGGDPDDYRTLQAVPEVLATNRVGEDSKVVLQFNLDASSAGTSIDFGATPTKFELDLTRYD